jgi:hypothetical protein
MKIRNAYSTLGTSRMLCSAPEGRLTLTPLKVKVAALGTVLKTYCRWPIGVASLVSW